MTAAWEGPFPRTIAWNSQRSHGENDEKRSGYV